MEFTRKFGIEIEAYNLDRQAVVELLAASGLQVRSTEYTHRVTDYWKVLTDGSIVADKPFELVSPVLRGLPGIQEAALAMKALEAGGAKVNKTCGLHIHFDAFGWQRPTFQLLAKNYAILEPLIDLFMPKSRRARNNTRYLDTLRDYSYDELLQSRFHKVNFQAFSRHSTIEFRHHSGTVEATKAMQWLLVCNRLLDMVQTNTRVQDGHVTQLFDQLFFESPQTVVQAMPRTLGGLKLEVYQLLGLDPNNRWASNEVRKYADLHGLANRENASLLSSVGWREVLAYLRQNQANQTVSTMPTQCLNVKYWYERISALDASIGDSNARVLLEYISQSFSALLAA